MDTNELICKVFPNNTIKHEYICHQISVVNFDRNAKQFNKIMRNFYQRKISSLEIFYVYELTNISPYNQKMQS